MGSPARSTFTLPDGTELPEFDRFGLFDWDVALGKVGKNLARVMGAVSVRYAGAVTLARPIRRARSTALRAASCWVSISIVSDSSSLTSVSAWSV